jgi:flagellar biosynthetic protein FliR
MEQFELLLREFTAYVGEWAPAYVLVLFRVAGMFVMAPMLGSTRMPKRVRVLLVAVIALGMAGAVPGPVVLPSDLATLTLGLGGELLFGIAMGMTVALAFVAAQWAGEVIGQQMGLQIAQAFDPQFGGAGSLIGDLYFMLSLAIFVSPVVDGPAAMLRGVYASLTALPLMSAGIDQSLLEMLSGLLSGSAMLAVQLAAPMLLTMLIVDVALGFIGKTMPQMNVMAAGLSIRVLVGMVVLVMTMTATWHVISSALDEALIGMEAAYTGIRS